MTESLNAKELHADATVVDGLVISNWSREVFEDLHAGGVTAVNCTCSIWEGLRDTLVNVGRWNSWFRDNDDLLLPVKVVADITRAKNEKRVGIILGWQNTSALEDRVELVDVFKTLGVGVMQLTYNTQNLVGSGCYESRDSGLSDFGRDVIDALIDRSRACRARILHMCRGREAEVRMRLEDERGRELLPHETATERAEIDRVVGPNRQGA